jgi:LacI family transcriptional regulator
VSLAEVARAAGVSLTTASRVINNTGYPVKESTRQRVLDAAARLNYSPSSLARALVTRRTHIIGIIVHDILDPYFAEIVRGVQDVALQHDYLTVICNSDRQVVTELNFLRMLHDYRADGVVLAGGGLEGDGTPELDQAISRLQTAGTSIIALAPRSFPLSSITIDNHQASREMTDYLIGLGHERIAYITGPANILTSEQRLRGFREGMAAAGLPLLPELIVPGNFDQASGRAAATHFLSLPVPPTAIFAANDETAIGCMAMLRRHGVCVPEEISVVGFDDIRLLENVDPPLTTVHVPLYEFGTAAMEHLLATFDGESQVSRVLGHRLVIRASATYPRTDEEVHSTAG